MKSLMLTIVLLAVLILGAACGGGGGLFEPDPQPEPETVKPEIQINGITEGEAYGQLEPGANTLAISAVAADDSGIANMSMRINDTLVAASNDATVNFDWDVLPYSDGSYEVEVQASDSNGNTATKSVTVYVNNVLIMVDPGLFPLFPEFEFDLDPFPWL